MPIICVMSSGGLFPSGLSSYLKLIGGFFRGFFSRNSYFGTISIRLDIQLIPLALFACCQMFSDFGLNVRSTYRPKHLQSLLQTVQVSCCKSTTKMKCQNSDLVCFSPPLVFMTPSYKLYVVILHVNR